MFGFDLIGSGTCTVLTDEMSNLRRERGKNVSHTCLVVAETW